MVTLRVVAALCSLVVLATAAPTTVAPTATTTKRKATTVAPTATTAKPTATTAAPKATTAKPKVTTTAPKATTAKPKATTLKPKVTTAAPKTTTVAPKVTTHNPKATTAAPKVTTAKPKVTTAVPKATTAAPKATTAAPKATTPAPKVTTAVSKATTAAPKATTAAPKATTAAPKVTTSVSKATTVAPKATTAAPKATTAALKATTLTTAKATGEALKDSFNPCAPVVKPTPSSPCGVQPSSHSGHKNQPKPSGMPASEKASIAVGSVAGAAALAGGIAAAFVESQHPHSTAAPFLAKVVLPTEAPKPRVVIEIPVQVPVSGSISTRLYHKANDQASGGAPQGIIVSMAAFAFFGLVFLSISGLLYVNNRAQTTRSFSRVLPMEEAQEGEASLLVQ